ncbi:helix-turn-helix domain-containing protein, partial [Hominenteromicrobium sp.]
MELYEKLYQLRKKSGFTQSELAEKLGISRQTVSNWELGTSVPPSKRLIEISKLYQVPIDYLLNEPKAEPLDTSSLDKSTLSTGHLTEPLSSRKSLLFKIKKRFFE